MGTILAQKAGTSTLSELRKKPNFVFSTLTKLDNHLHLFILNASLKQRRDDHHDQKKTKHRESGESNFE